MKARMKDHLVARFELALPNQLEPDNEDSAETISFLESIEGEVVDLVFTHGDAFEKNDDNIWLPESLWDAVEQEVSK